MADKAKNTQFNLKKNIGWMVVFVLIAALSVYAVIAQNSDFSAKGFAAYVSGANMAYILSAVVSMLGFIIFEGLAVLTICKAFGYKRTLRQGFIYSASDIYFSAITPSATGGQPICAWFMMRDRIPGAVSTVALIANLVFYMISIIIIGLITFVAAPGLFMDFSVLSKIFILVGYAVLAGLAALFILFLFKESIVHALGRGTIRILAKLKLVRKPERKLEKLERSMKQYKECSALIFKNKGAMLTAFGFNFLQRVSQITVTLLAFLAVGGDPAQSLRVWMTQSYVVIGSSCMPVPGAMGVSDYLLLDGLGTIMSHENAVNLELLSRSLSFYCMIAICGIAVLLKYILIFRRNKKNKEDPQ